MIRGLALAAMLLGLAGPAWPDDPVRLQITIRNHRFEPAELHVPANRAIVLDVSNEDATAEEFESSELHVEKIVAGGRQLPVRIRPLAPGRYPFMGEFHPDTAKGVLIADEGE